MQQPAQKTYYDVLDVPPYAGDDDIKLAYRRLVLFWHPDRRIHARDLAEENLKEINEAYSHLKNKTVRARYNKTLRHPIKSHPMQKHSPTHSWFGQFLAWMIKPVS